MSLTHISEWRKVYCPLVAYCLYLQNTAPTCIILPLFAYCLYMEHTVPSCSRVIAMSIGLQYSVLTCSILPPFVILSLPASYCPYLQNNDPIWSILPLLVDYCLLPLLAAYYTPICASPPRWSILSYCPSNVLHPVYFSCLNLTSPRQHSASCGWRMSLLRECTQSSIVWHPLLSSDGPQSKARKYTRRRTYHPNLEFSNPVQHSLFSVILMFVEVPMAMPGCIKHKMLFIVIDELLSKW